MYSNIKKPTPTSDCSESDFTNKEKNMGEPVITAKTDYDYEPENTGGLWLRLKKKGDKIKIRLCDKPVHFQRMWQGKPKEAFVWQVINREDGEIKLFQGGIFIYLAIKAFAKSEDWGDPTGYDFTIERTEQSTANFYTVTPSPKKSDITDKELEKLAEANIDVMEIVEKLRQKDMATSSEPPHPSNT